MKLFNRIRARTATTGTGPLAIGEAVPGFRPFAVIPAGEVVPYVIEDGAAWEMGVGTWAGGSLSRMVRTSSTGAALNLSGNAVVAVAPGAEDIVLQSEIETLRSELAEATRLLTAIINAANEVSQEQAA